MNTYIWWFPNSQSLSLLRTLYDKLYSVQWKMGQRIQWARDLVHLSLHQWPEIILQDGSVLPITIQVWFDTVDTPIRARFPNWDESRSTQLAETTDTHTFTHTLCRIFNYFAMKSALVFSICFNFTGRWVSLSSENILSRILARSNQIGIRLSNRKTHFHQRADGMITQYVPVSFDNMDLKSELLRGVYAYGSVLLAILNQPRFDNAAVSSDLRPFNSVPLSPW